MLRIIENSHAAGAKGYYSTSDYYTEGKELAGVWRGKGAERLGLFGEINKEDWDALCDNLNPETGTKLTVRQKANRRIGYDLNFHVPKSVSVLYGLTGDEQILEAFKDSVGETMREMESEMKTRVRKGKDAEKGNDGDRITGNMVWGEYVHTTARPVNGEPDPHLHAHCFAFNVTYDHVESRWKAGQFADLKRDAPYFEAVFHAKLSKKVADLGLPVERTKHGWEIAGVPRSVIDRFSRRTTQIEKVAEANGVTSAKEKGELGARTRQKKAKHLSAAELQKVWENALRPEEQRAMAEVTGKIGTKPVLADKDAAQHAVQHAADHIFERRSVVVEREFLREALRHGVGSATPGAISDQTKRLQLISAEHEGRTMLTSREVLAEESAMLDIARKGRGACTPLGTPTGEHTFTRDWLNSDQQRAVKHVLGSKDRVMLIRGAAGTGKTTMMKEAVEAIEASGRKVFTFAPSADASRGTLRNEGFENADTVAKLLDSPQQQEAIRDQVVWVDEAGLLGTKTMRTLFELAERSNARLVLSGDRRQHGSVERGAPLRLLETDAGLVPAEIREIQRQSGDYKRAVRLLSEGKVEEGFKGLDRMGWIREVPSSDRYKLMARDYVKKANALPTGERVLAISPTHREAGLITEEIRARLRGGGQLGKEVRMFRTLDDTSLTKAERSDAVNYQPGDVLVFHQNAKGFTRAQRVEVTRAGIGSLPLPQADRFGVFHASAIELAPGDAIRITRNGQAVNGTRLNNGELLTVTGFTPKGDIETQSGKVIGMDYGHLAYGYVVTSHASQGKSVSEVLVGQSSASFAASSREQFYVSVSRGKKRATIYTDNKRELLEAVGKSDPRLSATELIRTRVHSLRRQQEATPPPPMRPTPPHSRRDHRELDNV